MNITEQIDNFIELNGGNARDALNVALCRLDSAEARFIDLNTRLDAMHSEHDQALDEWSAEIKRAAQLEVERDELRREVEQAQRTIETQAKRIDELEQDVDIFEQERNDIEAHIALTQWAESEYST